MEEKYRQVVEALEKRGIKAVFIPTKEEARQMLLDRIPAGASVGIGGSMSIQELEVEEELAAKGCEVLWHWRGSCPEQVNSLRRRALTCDFYLASSNAITQDGRLVNIDGTGNRVMGMVYGPPRVILVVGINKLSTDLEGALDRVRREASPPNARRLKLKTPCAITGECNDCTSPDRMCKVVTIIEGKPGETELEVLLVGEKLGY
ncbi:MAG: lactate utilization protein [Firmicutes bacterium]|nr:lactate utilization protein [Bacillota bacterium]